jgi:hypothetical protein
MSRARTLTSHEVFVKTYPVMVGGEPAIVQPSVNGWHITWNPDDGRWYVSARPDGVGPSFKERRNAIQYAKRRPNPLLGS